MATQSTTNTTNVTMFEEDFEKFCKVFEDTFGRNGQYDVKGELTRVTSPFGIVWYGDLAPESTAAALALGTVHNIPLVVEKMS